MTRLDEVLRVGPQVRISVLGGRGRDQSPLCSLARTHETVASASWDSGSSLVGTLDLGPPAPRAEVSN